MRRKDLDNKFGFTFDDNGNSRITDFEKVISDLQHLQQLKEIRIASLQNKYQLGYMQICSLINKLEIYGILKQNGRLFVLEDDLDIEFLKILHIN